MRRFWLAAGMVLFGIPGCAPLAELPHEQARPPNVLWICADDFAPYVCGAYGNTQVKTPHLDRLAAGAARFRRAYCNAPVCTASRQSFLTGRYPRTIGVTLLKTPLPERETTLAEMLKSAGYATQAIGKMHFNSTLKHGFDRHIDLPDHRRHLQAKGAQPLPEGIEQLPPWKPFQDPARVWLNGFYRPYGAVDADMAGTFFAHQAVRYLKEPRDRPFFLMVSFTEPHSPFHFPVEFRGRHRPESFEVPRVRPEDDAQVPAVFRDLTDREKQGIIASYYTSVEFMDKNVGLVLDALRASDQESDTLVVFTGDHGYLLGQHGRFEKHCMYEPAVRSPLFICFPRGGLVDQSCDALVEFVDLVPTVLDWCGQPVPATIQGKSMRPFLEGRAGRHRDWAFAEYAENEEAMIRTERWKFIYGTGKRERQDGYRTGRPSPGRTLRLYDHHNDPEELTNLAPRAEYADIVAEFTQQLAEHLRRTARQPELIPPEGDVHTILEFCLQPRDVVSSARPEK